MELGCIVLKISAWKSVYRISDFTVDYNCLGKGSPIIVHKKMGVWTEKTIDVLQYKGCVKPDQSIKLAEMYCFLLHVNIPM